MSVASHTLISLKAILKIITVVYAVLFASYSMCRRTLF